MDKGEVVMVKDGDTGRRMIRSDQGYRLALLRLVLNNPQAYTFLPSTDSKATAKALGLSALGVIPERHRRGWQGARVLKETGAAPGRTGGGVV